MKCFFKKLLDYLLCAIILIVMIVGVVAPYIFAYIHHWLWLIPAVVDTALLINIFLKWEDKNE